ncbi:FG-GAP repeat domain-containing protein [Candidatus Magnetobacterium casense]|uniref:FG-GAP repeat domain-containing protein n=1 Tax=Candidatus Magnetobacterium casense TaxID=1455061 RepID=UPI00307CD874
MSKAKKDFDGDGKSDVLWQNTKTGDVAIWKMDGMSKKSVDFAANNVPANWRVKAAEDFDGDGKSDMLWQDIDTGDVYVWLMDNGKQKSGAYVARGIPAEWQIKLSEDFNGDGKSDILWQDSKTGAVYIWLMNGTEVTSGDYVVNAMPQDWYIRGVGDFNGDGKSDVLWQSRDVGDVFGWLMDGTKVQAGSNFVVRGLPPEWQIKSVADYNGDGNSDIYLHNTVTGKDVIWLMDGVKINGADFVKPKGGAGATSALVPMTGYNSDTHTWDMKSTGDYNGDGMNDMLWQDDSTGNVYMWTMDSSGTSYSGGYVDQGVPAD